MVEDAHCLQITLNFILNYPKIENIKALLQKYEPFQLIINAIIKTIICFNIDCYDLLFHLLLIRSLQVAWTNLAKD